MQELVFYSLATLIVFSALAVVSIKNPVHALLFLIFALFNASGLFILLGAEYIAMIIVIVYVGAVAVLFLFVIMMLDIDFSALKKSFVKIMPLGIILGIVLFLDLFYAINSSTKFMPKAALITQTINRTNVEMIGDKLYTTFFFPFQLSGLILFVAMVGSIVLTARHTKTVKRQNISKQVARKAKDTLELVKVKIGEGVDI